MSDREGMGREHILDIILSHDTDGMGYGRQTQTDITNIGDNITSKIPR